MTTSSDKKHASLNHRIRQFYQLLNQREFSGCFKMIDPAIRRNPNSVTLFQYQNALREFVDHFGSLTMVATSVKIYAGEPSEMYDGRDFAVGKTTWHDQFGRQQTFSERWVLDNGAWYTRSTGFVVPSAETVSAPDEVVNARETNP